jgi:hypothetical protein
MLRGRTYVLPEDMTDLVPDVLRHRLVLSYEALSEGLTADAVVSAWRRFRCPPSRLPRAAGLTFRNAVSPQEPPPEAPPDPVALDPQRETGSAERVLRRLEWTVLRRLDGLLQGDYRTLMRGAGSTWPTCASTSTTTTCATSTGTSPRACRRRTCACSPKTARWRPGSCST